MFLTHPHFRARDPVLPGSEAYSHWAIVEVAAHHPWFEVELFWDQEPDRITRTYLLSSTPQVIDLVQTMPADRRLIRMDAHLPPGYVGSSSWETHSVTKLWVAKLGSDDSGLPIGVLESSIGKMLPVLPIDVAELHDFRLLVELAVPNKLRD